MIEVMDYNQVVNVGVVEWQFVNLVRHHVVALVISVAEAAIAPAEARTMTLPCLGITETTQLVPRMLRC